MIENQSVYLESDIKALYERIKLFVGNRVLDLTSLAQGKWTNNEIAARYKIPYTRVSEWKQTGKYPRPISKNHVINLISGGFMTVEEITATCAESENDVKYLKRFNMFKNEELQAALRRAEDMGMDPAEILNSVLDKKSS